MSSPNGLSHCPHGLEYLSTLDQLVIEQKVSACEVMCKYEINNKYIVKNNVDQNVSLIQNQELSLDPSIKKKTNNICK